jgi:hypothetical protein
MFLTAGPDRELGNVDADASRMAKAVAKQIETFMITQKWISATSH